MRQNVSFKGPTQKFPGSGGWVYAAVPKRYTKKLKEQRRAWGMYPITASVGNTSWKTKLMMKKGGDFFVALKKSVRNKEKIDVGNKVIISFKID
jgi:hypothetical protein